MSLGPVNARLCAAWDEMERPGDFTFYAGKDVAGVQHDGAGILFLCPCGCGATLAANFSAEGMGPKWTWDGNRECPTVTPSIRQIGGCEWHGFLTAGRWLTC